MVWWRGGFTSPFRDRVDAGRQLAALLTDLADRTDVVVLALPRGGVPVGAEVARAIRAPLHAFLVRKLGAPGNAELAIGALASDGTTVLDRDILADLGVDDAYVTAEIARQRAELDRRMAWYGPALGSPAIEDRTVVLVDDGIATGSTVDAAIRALRQRRPAAIVLAVPVGSRDVLARLGARVERLEAVQAPEHLFGVGAWYQDFGQTPDEEVVRLLRAGGAVHDAPGGERSTGGRDSPDPT